MKWRVATTVLGLTLVASVAHARELYTSPTVLDLERGHWAAGDIFVGKSRWSDFGGLRLDARVALLPFLALRASTSMLTLRYSGYSGPDDSWIGRSWIGTELFTGWHSDDDAWRLRVGGSFELGAAPMGSDDSPVLVASLEEPFGNRAAWRAHAGASLSGNAGHLQLEVVDVRPFGSGAGYGFDRGHEIRLVVLSGAFALDRPRQVYFDAVLTDQVRFGAEVGVWQDLWGDRGGLGPHTSVALFASGDLADGENHGTLGIRLLHQR
jgi:hypothetical protein